MARDANFGNYFALQRKMLRLGGMSLRKKEITYYLMYSYGFQTFLAIYFLTLMLDILINANDFVIVVNTLYHMFAIASVIVKLKVVSQNGKRLGELLDTLESGMFAPNRNRGGLMEKELIKRCIRNSRLQSMLGCTATVIATMIPTIATMVNRISTEDPTDWALPFGKFSIFQPNRSPNFELTWLFQCVTFPLATVVYLSTDFMVADVSAQICVQFRILANSLSRVTITSDESSDFQDKNVIGLEKSVEGINVDFEPEWNYLRVKLRKNVQHHIAIVNLAGLFQETFEMLIFTDYGTVLFVLGCIMYLGSLYPPSDPFFQKFAMLSFGAVFQLLLISYWGNEVMLQSQAILNACYEVDFVGSDLRLQKGLSIIMTRSQRPIGFTVGKLSKLSLVSFVTVLRTSYSCYMLLRSRNQSA